MVLPEAERQSNNCRDSFGTQLAGNVAIMYHTYIDGRLIGVSCLQAFGLVVGKKELPTLNLTCWSDLLES